MSQVAYERVTKRFGAVTAVEDLTLEIESGELMVFVGPSGCGKTTSLRMLAGLEAVTSGTLHIGERAVERLAPKARDIAMVFQDYALYPQMTVSENLAFGLRLRKMKRAEIETRVKRAAEALDIGALLDRRPAALSGGQRQRVALGRALVREPQAFLMDEPLSNLDATLRTQTRGEIKALQQSVGVTTIYVTHDQVEAMTLGDRITVMRDGRVEQVGNPSEVYENPANMFVASFIGSPGMRFGRFAARSGGGVTEFVQGALRFTLPEELPVAGDVVVGVRPEHAALWSADAGLLGPLAGSVSYVEALGRETLVGVELGPDFELVVQVAGRCPFDPGERVEVGLRPGCLYFFDPGTERMLLRA